jgi:hypothetical protein
MGKEERIITRSREKRTLIIFRVVLYSALVVFKVHGQYQKIIRLKRTISAAHKSNPIKQTAKQINQICQNLISNQTNTKY